MNEGLYFPLSGIKEIINRAASLVVLQISNLFINNEWGTPPGHPAKGYFRAITEKG
ncbi:MAG: hypothetical protein QM640_09880 [Niabella sp.]